MDELAMTCPICRRRECVCAWTLTLRTSAVCRLTPAGCGALSSRETRSRKEASHGSSGRGAGGLDADLSARGERPLSVIGSNLERVNGFRLPTLEPNATHEGRVALKAWRDRRQGVPGHVASSRADGFLTFASASRATLPFESTVHGRTEKRFAGCAPKQPALFC
jgi:hypothetical protein